MPELPEAQTIADDLSAALSGRALSSVSVLNPKSVSGAPDLNAALSRRTLSSVIRRGKLVILNFDDASALAAGLGMTGQFLLGKEREDPPPHARVIFNFAAPEGKSAKSASKNAPPYSALYFRDIRKFGRLYYLPPSKKNLEAFLERKGVGPDPFEIEDADFREAAKKAKAPIKAFLLDQGPMSGLGNIYATEALFRAGIDPRRPAAELSGKEALKLLTAARELLKDAIEKRGSTISNYQAPFGPGQFQNFHKAYGKFQEKCPSCGAPFRKELIRGRGTVFCPRCQS
jgi:formamidopyrimidine-DNA glycosylase